MPYPTPPDWPDAFNIEAAEALISVALEESGSVDAVLDLAIELRWAIAQLRTERASYPTATPPVPDMWSKVDVQ